MEILNDVPRNPNLELIAGTLTSAHLLYRDPDTKVEYLVKNLAPNQPTPMRVEHYRHLAKNTRAFALDLRARGSAESAQRHEKSADRYADMATLLEHAHKAGILHFGEVA